jgi:NAD(P)-dependent dehydrogenase (short-subunit alcohol dehydrogenase family)
MSELFSLKDKVVIVTGAADGIGKTCAAQLASAGASVMLTDINTKACKNTADELSAKGYKVASVYHDVTKEADWLKVVDTTIETFGGLDCLVNNAGIYVGGILINNTLDDVRKVHEVNVDSIFLGMKHCASVMKKGGTVGSGGSIINISSVAGLIGIPGHTAYGSTKGAVRLYTKHAAVEFGRLNYGIRVNSIHPGLIATAMGDQVFDDLIEVGIAKDVNEAKLILNQMTPLGRIGTSEDIANMVIFLASDASTFCTGAEFVVDGGMSAC